ARLRTASAPGRVHIPVEHPGDRVIPKIRLDRHDRLPYTAGRPCRRGACGPAIEPPASLIGDDRSWPNDRGPSIELLTVIDGNHQRAAASQLVEERRVTPPQADSQDLVVRRRVPA